MAEILCIFLSLREKSLVNIFLVSHVRLPFFAAVEEKFHASVVCILCMYTVYVCMFVHMLHEGLSQASSCLRGTCLRGTWVVSLKINHCWQELQ